MTAEEIKHEFFAKFGKESFRGYPLEQCHSIWEFFSPYLKQDKWIKVSEQKPICYKTGKWDGKRSDELMVRNDNGKVFNAYCYEGVIDGRDFLDFDSEYGF